MNNLHLKYQNYLFFPLYYKFLKSESYFPHYSIAANTLQGHDYQLHLCNIYNHYTSNITSSVKRENT